MSARYTAITFAPIQGFIEKSRKLRDLYGSSYILSYLAWNICLSAEQAGFEVISPALINLTQGMPNQIVIAGELPAITAQHAFNEAWRSMTHACRNYIEENITETRYAWRREWNLWAQHTWEFFCESGQGIPATRQKLEDTKRSRAWTAINWTGESSTLSGADGIAWPQMGTKNPKQSSYRAQKAGIEAFYEALNGLFGDAFIDPDEELSIPELVKRIVTHEDVARAVIANLQTHTPLTIDAEAETQLLAIARELNPNSFKDLNRQKRKDQKTNTSIEEQHYTGWFLGDGDKAGDYLKAHNSAEEISAFSAQMREWGMAIRNINNTYLPGQGRMVYAGGDDFLGVLYERDQQIDPKVCFEWMGRFNRDIWQGANVADQGMTHGGNQPKPITASVGFVWAAPNVPQRDVLQNCHAAEQAAKQGGRDRIAFRILFNGGNYLEWICPWWVLEAGHIDISKNTQGLATAQAWTHFYNDVAALEGRHAFSSLGQGQTDVARRLFEIYFGETQSGAVHPVLAPSSWWNEAEGPNRISGILGDRRRYQITDPNDPEYGLPIEQTRFAMNAFNSWVRNLAKVGFHLTRPTPSSTAVTRTQQASSNVPNVA